MSISAMTARSIVSGSVHESARLRWLRGLQRRCREYGYAFALTLAATATIFALPGTAPSTDPVYAPLALALVAGLLLTVRLSPNRPSAALVLLPAMAMDARFGLAALPALAYAAVVVNLARGLRGPRVVSTASHQVLAVAAAHLASQAVPMLPDWVTLALVFSCRRLLL